MVVLNRNCEKCGKKLIIYVDKNGSYSGGNYYGTLKIGIGDWAFSKLENGKFKRCISIWEYIYLKMRDFKRLLFRQYKEYEIWFCENCDIDEEKDEDYD